MELSERLALERRARLAAERLLAQRTRELATAEERLAKHSRGLLRAPPPQPLAEDAFDKALFIRTRMNALPQAPIHDVPHIAPQAHDQAAQTAAQTASAAPSGGPARLADAPFRHGVPEHAAALKAPVSKAPLSSAPFPAAPFHARTLARAPVPAGPDQPPGGTPIPEPSPPLHSNAAPRHETGAPSACWPAIDALQDGLALFDAALRLLAANRSFCATFGLSEPQPGLELATLFARAISRGLIRRDDQPGTDTGIDSESGAAQSSRWLREATSCPPGTALPDLLLHLGEGGWIRLAAWRNERAELLCQVADITQQMRIWAALEAIPDGFVLFDSEDKMVICNQSYRDIYKTSAPVMNPGTSFEEILRYGLSQGEYPEAVGQEETWVSQRLAEHRGAAAEGEHQLNDGRWLRSIDKETPDGGRVGLRVDITQLREQAVALEAARQAAESANRAKSAFLANMSHEIRTPMNGVVGMAELLSDTPLSDEQRLFAETIRSSGEALLVIINDILDYSKIEAERLTLHPEDFDFERTIHEVVMLLQPRAREKGIDLMIDYDVFLPTRFTGDPGRLRQVLTNLIGNAVKFTAKGHVLARIVGMETEAGRYQLHVTIEDTGIGIPADLLEHVFGEFYQVEDEQNRKFEGTGLGLAITRRLIERMEGAVWVDSEYGKGSVFGFRLSLPQAEDAGPARLPVAIRSALVVDDQFINRTILERQLTTCGIEVSLCRSAREALEQVRGGARPDVVLTDHEMPGMDGIILATKLREEGYDGPVLLLSSRPPGARDEGREVCDAILQKPVLRAELYRLLTSLSEPETPEPALPAPVPTAPQTLRAMRILAAEDNRTNQLVLQKMLRSLDIDLHFVGNGHEAVAEWESFQPDLIFMDISMPGMDGRQATMAIRTAETARGLARVPIIALTAHAMAGDAGDILASGMDRYLTKPLRKSELFTAIAEFPAKGCRPPDPAQMS